MNYKVKKGDTLSKIAKEHNMSLEELLKLNGISRDKANHIVIGQNIKVNKETPTQGTSSSFIPQFNFMNFISPNNTVNTDTKFSEQSLQTTDSVHDKSVEAVFSGRYSHCSA